MAITFIYASDSSYESYQHKRLDFEYESPSRVETKEMIHWKPVSNLSIESRNLILKTMKERSK